MKDAYISTLTPDQRAALITGLYALGFNRRHQTLARALDDMSRTKFPYCFIACASKRKLYTTLNSIVPETETLLNSVPQFLAYVKQALAAHAASVQQVTDSPF